MGKNTRLSFQYWLKGTDTLRVQIYSLTNGYHRHLVLTGLPQGKWQEATVDMTVARRPDGTGGPLSEGERIDDIQFYTDPTAELVVDDIVLYDAAGADEKRSFPRKVHFTGWFDSGKQGKEWPGAFDIVPDKGYYWHAARSVPNADGVPWVRLHLRGLRPLGRTTALSFRYRLTGATSLVVTVGGGKGVGHTLEVRGLAEGRWAQATVDITRAPGGGAMERSADQVHFVLPKGAELLLDDVLLFEPR
jgi:hypothetical protein